MNEQSHGSEDNSRKLDRILAILQGEEGAPGLLRRVSDIEHTLNGTNEAYGLATRVSIMWKIWVWMGWLLGAIIGSGVTIIVSSVFHIKL